MLAPVTLPAYLATRKVVGADFAAVAVAREVRKVRCVVVAMAETSTAVLCRSACSLGAVQMLVLTEMQAMTVTQPRTAEQR